MLGQYVSVHEWMTFSTNVFAYSPDCPGRFGPPFSGTHPTPYGGMVLVLGNEQYRL